MGKSLSLFKKTPDLYIEIEYSVYLEVFDYFSDNAYVSGPSSVISN